MVSVINTVDTSHEDMIHDAQMDYYGTRLATCSSDRSVKIFDVRNGGQILVADLRGHEGPVWQVAWAHPMYGNILASCSYDRKVIIWKEENGTWEKTHEHTGHDSSVNSVCWAPHDYGLILACGSSDGAISLLTYTGLGQWEVKKINNAHTIGCNAVSWAPAVVPGSLIDQPSGQKPNYIKKFASGGCDNLIKLWKEEEDGQWKEEQKLEAHSDWVRDVAWAPSIGLPTSTIASCSQVQYRSRWRRCHRGGLPPPPPDPGLLSPGWPSVHLDLRRCLGQHVVSQAAAQVQRRRMACQLVHHSQHPGGLRWRQ
nr:protein SEC13 homolog isoform X2 [Ovis aries]